MLACLNWVFLAFVGLCWALLGFLIALLCFVGLFWYFLFFVCLFWPLFAVCLCLSFLVFVGICQALLCRALMCLVQRIPHLRKNHYRGFHYRGFWLMCMQVGDFRVSKGPPTVPLMWISSNAVFYKSLNPHKAGTLCTISTGFWGLLHGLWQHEKKSLKSTGGWNATNIKISSPLKV